MFFFMKNKARDPVGLVGMADVDYVEFMFMRVKCLDEFQTSSLHTRSSTSQSHDAEQAV